MPDPAPTVSVVVLTLNEEANLPDLLASLDGLACDVYVVDSGSTDATAKIAEQSGARVVVHPFLNYGLQRNWAIDNLPIRTPWILHLDADERLTPALRDHLRDRLEDAPADLVGYRLQQHTHWMGRWIKHGGFHPFHQLRLVRTGRGRYEERPYDQRLVADGPTGQLEVGYVNVVTDSLTTWIARHNRWATLEAETRVHGDPIRANVRPTGPIEKRLWRRERVYYRQPKYWRALAYFLYRYVAKGGFLDGRQGLVFHTLHGFWYRFLVDAKIDEIERSRKDVKP